MLCDVIRPLKMFEVLYHRQTEKAPSNVVNTIRIIFVMNISNFFQCKDKKLLPAGIRAKGM